MHVRFRRRVHRTYLMRRLLYVDHRRYIGIPSHPITENWTRLYMYKVILKIWRRIQQVIMYLFPCQFHIEINKKLNNNSIHRYIKQYKHYIYL